MVQNRHDPVKEAAEANKLPSWEMMDKTQRTDLLQKVLLLLLQGNPVPRPMLEPLPLPLLHKLLMVVRRLQNEGMMGPRHRLPERLRRMRELLSARGLEKPRQPTENEVLAMQPRSLQQQVRAQEALGLREAQGRAMVGMQQTLAATNAPELRFPAGTE